jgi:hypothetical protein
MSREVLISTILGALVAIAAGWFFAWYYYKRAGDELQKESGELRKESVEVRRKIDMLLVGLERARLVELQRNADGTIVNIDIRAVANLTIPITTGSASAKLDPDKKA